MSNLQKYVKVGPFRPGLPYLFYYLIETNGHMNKNNYLFNFLIETNGNIKENNYLFNYFHVLHRAPQC